MTTTTYSFVFVLEQTLGHAAHSRNLERALADERGTIGSSVIRLDHTPPGPFRHIPGLRSWSFQASWAARVALMEQLRCEPVDAAFIHTQVASLLAARAMRSVPTVISLDATPRNFDDVGAYYGHRRSPRLVEAVKRLVNQRAFHRSRLLVTWCQWAARSLVADYGVPETKVRVIYPGVDVRLFRADRPCPPRQEPVHILFVGGDCERKGGHDLLEVARVLGGLAELDLVTNSAPAVPAGVTCRVHQGLRPQSTELVELYRRADVFALPSRGDCFPQAVAEALAAGLPVVATSVGAIPEMVHDSVNGYLVPPGDQRALAQALNAVVGDARKREAMGRCSRRLAEREHDADRNNRRIFGLMAELASTAGGGRRSPRPTH